MGHSFKPVTTGEQLQVAILDELQKITSLLEPSQEPPAEPEPPADAPAEDKPEPEAPAKKTAPRRATKKVDGR